MSSLLFIALLFFLLLAIGVPNFLVISIPTIATIILYYPELSLPILAQQMISGVSPFPLIAIPLFIFAAEIIIRGKLAEKLIGFAIKLVGHLHGGLAQTLCLSCLFFGALSGSTQATVAAIGGTIYPSMIKEGYEDTFALGLVINASNVAQLIPPSTSMIIYGVITGSSVGALFIAGIIPGIILGLLYMIYVWWWAKRHSIPRQPRAGFRELMNSIKDSKWAFGLPFIIIGGIYSGLVTPTEAASIVVAYSIIIEIFVYKTIKVKDLYSISLKTANTTAIVFILVAAAKSFAWILTYARVPQLVSEGILSFMPTKMLLLLIMDAIFFVSLMFFDGITSKLVLLPIFYPLALLYNIDPIHFGVLVTLNCAIGSATPPFGVDIFTACAIFDKPFFSVVKGVPPFILIGIIAIVLMTFVPEISLFLPGLLK